MSAHWLLRETASESPGRSCPVLARPAMIDATRRIGQYERVAHDTVTIAGSQVVLTGASGGLGGAIARALDDRGAHLVLTGPRVDALALLR